ncbi:lipopolysaccharide core heptose(I) kinase RfaP [Pseudomonas sp. PCH446]
MARDLQEPVDRQTAGPRRGQEWRAIQRLQEVAVPTMTAVAYGERGSNPADQHSFIVTEELAPTVSLEDFSMDWPKQPPEPRLKRALIAEVARMTGMMHRAGVNHRDCYICHFLLHTDKPVTAENLKLSVIDLHRAQTRATIPARWRNKDLAALYFSVLDIGLTRRDRLRFLKGYFRQPLRQILRDEAALLVLLERKAEKLYRRKLRYGGAL